MDPLLIAKGQSEIFLLPEMANRHGLIAGATGTGKTVTLQVIAENLSAIGVPVFVADIKGDLTGISQVGGQNAKVIARIKDLQLGDYPFSACPVTLWDVFGELGHPVRSTISEMGPLLLSRLLRLNETQSGVLNLVFKIADENGLLLLDLKDIRAMVQHVGNHASTFTTQYGNISTASIGAIQRGLLALESEGGDKFFGEPALNIDDLIQTDANGRGVVNILAADKLMSAPKVYSTLLLWLLSELFERLPEVGDQPKPKMVFFFDEAHLLFTDVPSHLLEKIEQVVRLIRSKGIGVYFVTQNPRDIPDNVLGQLGNRVGEALVSFLDEKGQPAVVERAFIVPPKSQIGPITPEQRRLLIQSSVVAGVYEKAVDRESAYELLTAAAAKAAGPDASASSKAPSGGILDQVIGGATRGITGGRARRNDTIVEAMAKSVARSLGSSVGRALIRGILGSLFGKGR